MYHQLKRETHQLIMFILLLISQRNSMAKRATTVELVLCLCKLNEAIK